MGGKRNLNKFKNTSKYYTVAEIKQDDGMESDRGIPLVWIVSEGTFELGIE